MQPETSLGIPENRPQLRHEPQKVFVTIEPLSVQTQIALSYFCLLRQRSRTRRAGRNSQPALPSGSPSLITTSGSDRSIQQFGHQHSNKKSWKKNPQLAGLA